MDEIKTIASIVAVLVSISSLAFAFFTYRRTKKAEEVKQLLGDKESVSYAALRLLREGLPGNQEERKLVIAALVQACVFEGSDRARALLYRVLESNRKEYGQEFTCTLQSVQQTFDNMEAYQFTKDELDLQNGKTRIGAIKKILDKK